MRDVAMTKIERQRALDSVFREKSHHADRNRARDHVEQHAGVEIPARRRCYRRADHANEIAQEEADDGGQRP